MIVIESAISRGGRYMKIRLEEFRNRRKMNQRQLSDASGVPQPMISDIENGNVQNPTVRTMFRLAKALRCLIDDLIEDDQESAKGA